MDRRSWPWKKKSAEKNTGSLDSADSSPVHSSRHSDDQVVAKILGDHVRGSDDGLLQWHHAEEKVKHLNEKLSSALLDVTAKEELINQHAKVADEAVSGWEKAEKEAASLKQQLDVAIQQKLATEDRVSHLDAALKECMRQLRRAREEQEEKIHEAIVKKTRDWDAVRSELEEKLADMEEKYLERDAESEAMSKLLQERAINISAAGEACARAQSDVNMLQIQLNSTEKENVALRYERNILKKELEIRNEESAMSKKASEAANKRHLEEAKKVAKLDAECQRLRGLLRKKVPSPGALAQLKLELDFPAKESIGKRAVKGAGLPRDKPRDFPRSTQAQEEPSTPRKDVDVLTERLSSMEEETRRLKELLERRDKDLQLSRLMCVKTAGKISSLEQQHMDYLGVKKPFDTHLQAERMCLMNSCEASVASVSDDGEASCAESWASALIAELDHFKKDKANLNASKLEEELASLQSQKGAICLTVLSLQEKLDTIFAAQEDGRNIENVIDQIRASMGMPRQGNILEEEASSLSSDADFKLFALGPELTSTVCKLVRYIEDLSMAISAQQLPNGSQGQRLYECGNLVIDNNAPPIITEVLCRHPELDPKVQTFIVSSNQFLHGKVDLLLFIAELSSVLSHLTDIAHSSNYGSSQSFYGDKTSCEINGSFSSISYTSKSDDSEKEGIKVAPGDDRKTVSKDSCSQEVLRIEEELRKVCAEKVAYETHMRMEFERFSGIEQEAIQLRSENAELAEKLQITKEELQHLKKQCIEADQAMYSLEAEVSSIKLSKQLVDEQLFKVSASRAELEARLQTCQIDHGRLQDRVETLNDEIVQEHAKKTTLEANCRDLKEQLLKSTTSLESRASCPKCDVCKGDTQQTSKEQEIAAAAEKLAECQRTILLLGEQLKVINPSKEPNGGEQQDVSCLKSADEPTSKWHSFSNVDGGPCNDKLCPPQAHEHPPRRKNRKFRKAKKEMAWDPHRDSNASDVLEAELASLSKSGKPLLELFGEKTPLHEDYIQALEEMPSSSSEEKEDAQEVKAVSFSPSIQAHLSKPPLDKKKGLKSLSTGVQVSKSTNAEGNRTPNTSSEKHNSFARLFFSKSKGSHP